MRVPMIARARKTTHKSLKASHKSLKITLEYPKSSHKSMYLSIDVSRIDVLYPDYPKLI